MLGWSLGKESDLTHLLVMRRERLDSLLWNLNIDESKLHGWLLSRQQCDSVIVKYAQGSWMQPSGWGCISQSQIWKLNLY